MASLTKCHAVRKNDVISHYPGTAMSDNITRYLLDQDSKFNFFKTVSLAAYRYKKKKDKKKTIKAFIIYSIGLSNPVCL